MGNFAYRRTGTVAPATVCFRRVAACVAIMSIAHVLPARADEPQRPEITFLQANAPGALTVAWSHQGSGVVGFAVQVRKADSRDWRSTATVGHDKASYTVVGLEPSQAYIVRVCAAYADEEPDAWCSVDRGPVTTMAPEPPRRPKEPAAPVILPQHDSAPTSIGIRWEAAHNYDSYFVNVTEKAAPGRPGNLRTIHHDDDGTWGYQRVENLEPGRRYIFQVQGCTEVWAGLLNDRCWGWSAPVEFATAPAPPPAPPAAFDLRVAPESTNWIYVDWRGVPASAPIDRIVLEVGGAVHQQFPGNQRAYRHSVRANTVYRYRVCLHNAGGQTCSGPVSGMGQPTTPAAPVEVTVQKTTFAGGGVDISKMRQATYVDVRWRNGAVPGRYVTIEREEVVQRDPTRIATERRWIEVERLDGEKDPVRAMVSPTGRARAIVESSTYRVCAVVPELGPSGTVCSAPATLRREQ